MSKKNQVYTGGYGANDPYQYARDNHLGPLECDVVSYVTRHNRGQPTGQKYGARDVLAAIATLTRLGIDQYGTSEEEAVGVVREMYRRRRCVEMSGLAGPAMSTENLGTEAPTVEG